MKFGDFLLSSCVTREVGFHTCLVLIFGAVVDPEVAQAQMIEWVQSAGGTGALAVGRGISVDATGNSHVTGFATNSVMFGPLPVTSGGFFVAKYDPDGYPLWVRSATQSYDSEGSAIVTDLAGNSYITGSFGGMMIVGNSTFSSSGGADVFVAKYDSAGNVLWARSAGSHGYDRGLGIAIDAAGNAHVTGVFSYTASFGETTLTSAGVVDVFVAKYDPEGNLLWVRSAGGTSDDVGSAIACDTWGNCFVTGFVTGTATFGHITLTGGASRVYLAKYDSGGNVMWARTEGPAFAWGLGIAVDAAGDPYLTGSFGYQNVVTILFGSLPLTSVGGGDVFVVKYDGAGSAVWARSAGGASDDRSLAIDVDSAGNSFVTGYYEDSISIGSFSLASSGGKDVFAAKYDAHGNVLWANSAGGVDEDRGNGVSIDDAGNCVVTGSFHETAVFESVTLHSGGHEDLFVAKYNTCGDGIADPGQECDGGSGCVDCFCDLGFEPTVPPSPDCQPECGNATIDSGEECDGANDAACPGACLADCSCGSFCGDATCGPGENSCNCADDCGGPPAAESPDSTCDDGIDNDCDGAIDAVDPDCRNQAIPTVSIWGLIVLSLLLLTSAKVCFVWRRTSDAPL